MLNKGLGGRRAVGRGGAVSRVRGKLLGGFRALYDILNVDARRGRSLVRTCNMRDDHSVSARSLISVYKGLSRRTNNGRCRSCGGLHGRYVTTVND